MSFVGSLFVHHKAAKVEMARKLHSKLAIVRDERVAHGDRFIVMK